MLVGHHKMFPQRQLALLLWRLRREFGVYLLGAGSPSPIVPMAATLLLATAASYVHLGSFLTEAALTSVLTERVQAQARGTTLGMPVVLMTQTTFWPWTGWRGRAMGAHWRTT